MPETTIYGLVDPRNGRCRYVGKANDPQKRLRGHISGRARKPDCYSRRWLRGLADAGASPILVVLEVVPVAIWEERERFWIAEMRRRGELLTNVADGGGGGTAAPLVLLRCLHCGSEFRLRPCDAQARGGRKYCGRSCLYAALKGRPKSEAHRQAMSETRRGRKLPPEQIARLVIANTGRHHTAEAKAKVGAANRGRPRPDAAVLMREMRAAAGGKPPVTLPCGHCGKTVTRRASALYKSGAFCCRECCAAFTRGQKREGSPPAMVDVQCAWCGTVVQKYWQSVENSKSGRLFCNGSCAMHYRVSQPGYVNPKGKKVA